MTLLPTHPRLILTILAISLIIQSFPCHAEPIDRIVAIVNDEVITATELARSSEKTFNAIRNSTPPDKLDAALKEAREVLLDKMIDNRLILQKAKEFKFNPSPEEVDSAIDRLAADNHLTREQLMREVRKEGFSEDEYHEFTADQIRRSRLVNFQITSRIVISEERAREYYENVYTKGVPPPGYHLLQMGFVWGVADAENATREEAAQRAERIRKLVEDGQDFRELARSFSDLPSAKDGGDLGSLKLREMATDMRNLLINLEPGGLSPVKEISRSMQFFQVLEINADNKVLFPPFPLVKNFIMDKLFQEEMDKRLENWMKELREQAIIKKLL